MDYSLIGYELFIDNSKREKELTNSFSGLEKNKKDKGMLNSIGVKTPINHLMYKEKYLKYKNKYLQLKGGIHPKSQQKPSLKPWLINKPPNNKPNHEQFYISVQIDKDSPLGQEYIKRITDLKTSANDEEIYLKNIKIPYDTTTGNPFIMHTTLLEILICKDSELDKKIKIILRDLDKTEDLKNKIKPIYEVYFNNKIIYSKTENYECLGNFFARIYDEPLILTETNEDHTMSKDYLRFKYMIIITLLKTCGLTCKNLTTIQNENYQYYFYNNKPLFAIKNFFDKPDEIKKTGWKPHVSMFKDDSGTLCKNPEFLTKFIDRKKDNLYKSIRRRMSRTTQNDSVRLLPFWNKEIKKDVQIKDSKIKYKNIEGAISSLLFTYNRQSYDIIF
jgi:hypothetical protein